MQYSVTDENLGPSVHGKINIDKRYIKLGNNQPRPRYHIAFLHEKLHTLFPVPCDEATHKDIVILATALGPMIPILEKIKGPVSIVEQEYNYYITKSRAGKRVYTKDEMYDFVVRTILWYYKINHFDKVPDIIRIMKIKLNGVINI